MHPSVHSSIVHNSQLAEASEVPINRWLDLEDVVCVYLYIQSNFTQP